MCLKEASLKTNKYGNIFSIKLETYDSIEVAIKWSLLQIEPN